MNYKELKGTPREWYEYLYRQSKINDKISYKAYLPAHKDLSNYQLIRYENGKIGALKIRSNLRSSKYEG